MNHSTERRSGGAGRYPGAGEPARRGFILRCLGAAALMSGLHRAAPRPAALGPAAHDGVAPSGRALLADPPSPARIAALRMIRGAAARSAEKRS